MEPIKFEEHNIILAENQQEYLDLPIYRYEDGTVVSCWKFTFWERLKILLNGKMWLGVLTFGDAPQPVRPSVDKEDQFGAVYLKDQEMKETKKCERCN